MKFLAMALEYLKVLLSWPVIVGLIVVWVIRQFRKELSNLLERVATIKFPGGELTTSVSQLERQKEELPSKGEQPTPLQVTIRGTGDVVPAATSVDLSVLAEQLKAEQARAVLWEYRYLNYFLARGTQDVLGWLASLPINTSLQMYDSTWLPFIPLPHERQAIIDALRAHWLIDVENELIRVSPKGHEYLSWRGPLPPILPVVRSN